MNVSGETRWGPRLRSPALVSLQLGGQESLPGMLSESRGQEGFVPADGPAWTQALWWEEMPGPRPDTSSTYEPSTCPACSVARDEPGGGACRALSPERLGRNVALLEVQWALVGAFSLRCDPVCVVKIISLLLSVIWGGGCPCGRLL